MLTRLRTAARRQLTPSLVISVVALMVSLSGVAWAAATIGSAQIIDNSVQTADIRNGNVQSVDIKDYNVTIGDIGPNAINSARIVDNSVAPGDLTAAAKGRAESWSRSCNKTAVCTLEDAEDYVEMASHDFTTYVDGVLATATLSYENAAATELRCQWLVDGADFTEQWIGLDAAAEGSYQVQAISGPIDTGSTLSFQCQAIGADVVLDDRVEFNVVEIGSGGMLDIV